MTAIDLHPEDLLDRARDGGLTADQREKLDLHLASCSACRLALRATADFEAERAPRPGDDALLARVLESTSADLWGSHAELASVRRTTDAERSPTDSTSSARRRLAIGLSALTVAAAAGAVLYATSGSRGGVDIAAEPELRSQVRHRIEEPSKPDEPQRGLSSFDDTDRPSRDLEPNPSRPARPPLRTPVAPAPGPAPETPAEPTASSAADLFASANTARRDSRSDEAVRLYEELQARFPGSREAETSRVSEGKLRLDALADPAGALAEFDAYLVARPDGALAEEARLGRALSLEKLGRRGDERAAWSDLLARHPTTLYREQAERRLGTLR